VVHAPGRKQTISRRCHACCHAAKTIVQSLLNRAPKAIVKLYNASLDPMWINPN